MSAPRSAQGRDLATWNRGSPGISFLVESLLVESPHGMTGNHIKPRARWLNRTVWGIGLASLFSDWSHEIATTVMPTFLATMGVAAL